MSQMAVGASRSKKRPKYLNLVEIRQPITAWVSILHRISGFLLFFPFVLWLLYLLDMSLSSEQDFNHVREYLAHPIAKLGMLLLIWSFAHHFCAGIRYLLLDLDKGIEKETAKLTAGIAIAAGLVITAVAGVWLW
jgi:succinate dehydrogenase / fumarate reductase cytochrome b subunit